jgi:hypothetical protein
MTNQYNPYPRVELPDRKPLEEKRQQSFYGIADEYELISARVRWSCHNEDCGVTIPIYSYYYKHKGSKAYWHFKRRRCWDRVCQNCYFDHVLDPSTMKWRRRMEARLRDEAYKIERAIEKAEEQKQAVRRR